MRNFLIVTSFVLFSVSLFATEQQDCSSKPSIAFKLPPSMVESQNPIKDLPNKVRTFYQGWDEDKIQNACEDYIRLNGTNDANVILHYNNNSIFLMSVMDLTVFNQYKNGLSYDREDNDDTNAEINIDINGLKSLNAKVSTKTKKINYLDCFEGALVSAIGSNVLVVAFLAKGDTSISKACWHKIINSINITGSVI